MDGISNPLLAMKNKILQGYAAFNDWDRDTLESLLCPDVVWYPEDGGAPVTGRNAVLDHLEQLRSQPTEAELLGVVSTTNATITLDLIYDAAGVHGCADKIEFDASGCIAKVWHCSAGTHHQGVHPGHGTHKH